MRRSRKVRRGSCSSSGTAIAGSWVKRAQLRNAGHTLSPAEQEREHAVVFWVLQQLESRCVQPWVGRNTLGPSPCLCRHGQSCLGPGGDSTVKVIEATESVLREQCAALQGARAGQAVQDAWRVGVQFSNTCRQSRKLDMSCAGDRAACNFGSAAHVDELRRRSTFEQGAQTGRIKRLEHRVGTVVGAPACAVNYSRDGADRRSASVESLPAAPRSSARQRSESLRSARPKR
jgi:hypothetical protein